MIGLLQVIAGPDSGRTFSLEDGTTLNIGRGETSSTKLRDPHASRRHCVLEVDGGRFVLRDEGSAAGTFVNGNQVKQCELKPGDVIRLGTTELRLVIDADPEASTLVSPPPGQARPAKAAPLEELVGRTLAHYEIRKVIASGETGMVFLAHDTKASRPTAVKVLWPEITQVEEDLQRFVRAMKTMMPLRHENIIEIYAAGKNGPHAWVAMEFVEGESLDQVIKRIGTAGMLDWRTAFRVCVHIGRALDAAHEKKIIHRNITPPNIMLRRADKVAKLGDLMLAKALEGVLAQPVTQPGRLLGDLGYMPPERTKSGVVVDCRSDIYSLGAAVYALLTGRPPFEADSMPQLISKIRQLEPEKPKKFQMSIADRFQDVVLTMLAKRPENRFETPARLLTELDRIARYENLEV
jgi:serine/threonine protein kinase